MNLSNEKKYNLEALLLGVRHWVVCFVFVFLFLHVLPFFSIH